jgi:hypothetical protein
MHRWGEYVGLNESRPKEWVTLPPATRMQADQRVCGYAKHTKAIHRVGFCLVFR